MGFQIKYFVKNAVTSAAFQDKTFYGAGASGQAYADGYPNQACTLAGSVDLTPYEMTSYVDAETTMTINGSPTPTTTVDIGDTILDSSFVGSYWFDFANPQEPVFICVASSITDNNTFVADRTFSVDLSYTNVAYIKSGATNFQGFKVGQPFYVMVGVIGPDQDVSTFPQIKGITADYSTITKSGVADTDYLGVKKVSALGNPESSSAETDVTCTVKRINTFIGGTAPNTYFRANEDKPFWICYEVNPYGNSSTTLAKKTRYKAYCTENLEETSVTYNFTYTSASAGWI